MDELGDGTMQDLLALRDRMAEALAIIDRLLSE